MLENVLYARAYTSEHQVHIVFHEHMLLFIICIFEVGKRINIIAVELQAEKDPSKAKTKQRNYIAKILEDYHKEAALVAFYSSDKLSWKLSFVKLDFSFNKIFVAVFAMHSKCSKRVI